MTRKFLLAWLICGSFLAGNCLAAPTGSALERFRIVVWNVRNYQEPDTPPLDSGHPLADLEAAFLAQPVIAETQLPTPPRPKTAEEAGLLVETLVRLRPDLLVLVEMGPPRHLARLQTRLAEAGLALPHVCMVLGPDRDRHLAALSTVALADDSVAWAEIAPARSARYVNRGILGVRVQLLPGLELLVAGLHLKSAFEEELAPEIIRREEALAVRAFLEEWSAAHGDAPLFVVGDVNDDRASASLREILGRGENSAPQLAPLNLEDATGDRWTHYWAVEDAYTRIDFVLGNRAARNLVDAEGSFIERYPPVGEVSDHRALVVTLKLPRGGTPQ